MHKSLHSLRTFIRLKRQCFGVCFKSRDCKNYLTHLNSTNIKWTEEQDPLGDTKEKNKINENYDNFWKKLYLIMCCILLDIFKYFQIHPTNASLESRQAKGKLVQTRIRTLWTCCLCGNRLKDNCFPAFRIQYRIDMCKRGNKKKLEKGGERTLFLIIPFQWPRKKSFEILFLHSQHWMLGRFHLLKFHSSPPHPQTPFFWANF